MVELSDYAADAVAECEGLEFFFTPVQVPILGGEDPDPGQKALALLPLMAQLLRQAAKDIDEMFPNDNCPEMQTDLRSIADKAEALVREGDRSRGK